MNRSLTDRQRTLWLMAAMAAPLSRAASLCSWPAVLTMGSITLLISRWLQEYRVEPKPWLRVLQSLWASVVAGEMLYWCQACWPSHSNPKAAALILLGLCLWLACQGPEPSAAVGCVLIWPVALLLGGILLAALPEIKSQNLYPQWRMPSASMVTILLLPTLPHGGKGRGSMLLLGVALLVSVVTVGVLSANIGGNTEGGIYELSRSIAPFGSSQRLESLAAVGMTLGCFAGLTYLLSQPREGRNRERKVLLYGILGGLRFALGIRIDSGVIAIGALLLWVILPALCAIKKFFQKQPKSA